MSGKKASSRFGQPNLFWGMKFVAFEFSLPRSGFLRCRTDNLVKNFFHNGKLTGEKPAKGKKRRADEEDVGRESDSYNLAKVKKMKTQRREIHSCGLARGKRQTKKQELVLDSDSHAQGKKRKAKKSELFAGAVNDDFAQGYTAAMLTAALAYTAQPPMSRNLGTVQSSSPVFTSLMVIPIIYAVTLQISCACCVLGLHKLRIFFLLFSRPT